MPNKIWDAVIIGAGPAGSVSAALLAGRGWRVLLLERSCWPREKVCGGCINAAAIDMLRAAGLGNTLRSPDTAKLNQFAPAPARSVYPSRCPKGFPSRAHILDFRVVDEAIRRGCAFISSAAASLLPAKNSEHHRTVRVTTDNTEQLLHAKIVLACDGISGSSLDHELWAKWQVSPTSYFGVATTLYNSNSLAAPATIAMHIGSGGYVGTAKYSDGRTHLAAAIDSLKCRAAGGPAQLVTDILRQCSIDIPDELDAAKFHGTGLLTRRRESLGGHRVLAVGDSCGYVEPFTGEGIAWAILSAREVTNLLPNSPHDWPANLPAQWLQRHRATIGKQQHLCRLLRQTLRHPNLTKLALTAATLFPAISKSLAHHIGQPSFSNLPNLNLQGVAE